MAKKQKAWAVRRRARLIQELGGKCAECGRDYGLEVDHINGRDWCARELGSDQRVCRYIREAREGLVQVLCKPCNSSKGDPNGI